MFCYGFNVTPQLTNTIVRIRCRDVRPKSSDPSLQRIIQLDISSRLICKVLYIHHTVNISHRMFAVLGMS
jgi:hypothetical protein